MYPRPSPTTAPETLSLYPPAFTHACVARKLLQRAVRHLQHLGGNAEQSSQPEDDAKLIEQALERLAVADLLIDAYTRPPTDMREATQGA